MNTPPPTKKCPMCAEEIKADAKKCKHCGELLHVESKPVPAPATEGSPFKKMPYWKALPSVIGVGFIMISSGLLLTFTIIGGLVGIPLILTGIFSIIGSPVLAFFAYESACPNCQGKIVWMLKKHAVKCRHCKQRSVVRDMRLMPLKTFVKAA